MHPLVSPMSVFIISSLVLLFGHKALFHLIKRLTPGQTTAHLLLETLDLGTKVSLVLTFSLGLALTQVQNLSEYQTSIRYVLFVIGAIQILIWGNRVITFGASQALKKANLDGDRTTILSALEFFSKCALFFILLVLTLDNLGFNISTLVTGLGIGGVAVALAVQNILGDVFSSISILIDKPFVVGDVISVDELTGTVEKIGLKTTRVKSATGEQIIFSNSDLLKSRIRNFKRMSERNMTFRVTLAMSTPQEKLNKLALLAEQAVGSASSTRFERATLIQIREAGFDFEIAYSVLQSALPGHLARHHEILLELIKKLSENGIQLSTSRQL